MEDKLETTFKKPSRKPKIVVRQTLTSKLRAERGDKLQYLKTGLQMLTENQSIIQGNSKESLNSDNFKKDVSAISSKLFTTPDQRVSLVKSSFTSTDKIKKIQTSTRNYTASTMTVDKTVSNQPKERSNPLLNKSMNITYKNTINKNNKLPLISNRTKTISSNKYNSEKLSLPPSKINSVLKSNIKPKGITQTRTTELTVKKDLDVAKCVKDKNINQKSALKSKTSTNVKKSVTLKSPVRKSLSAIHLKRVINCDKNSTIHRSSTWSNGLNTTKKMSEYLSPVKDQSFSFQTPLMNQRRSVAFQTPMSSKEISISPYTIISTPNTSDLKRRLSLWLEKKGKPLDSFHHLRCFNINSCFEIDEDNKENFEIYIPSKDSSYEDLKITSEKPIKIEDSAKNISLANDALYDLYKLITDGYPRDQCEAWLNIVCSKYQDVQEKSQYWECRAALEEARGNFQSALDCYNNAIVKGAEVEKINEPLDNMLEKFSVLNISHSETQKISEQQKTDALNARNIFKSSFIGFAIQKQKNDSQLTATPVRRSSRKSRSHYISTPNVKVCSSLKTLDASTRESIRFQTNRALLH